MPKRGGQATSERRSKRLRAGATVDSEQADANRPRDANDQHAEQAQQQKHASHAVDATLAAAGQPFTRGHPRAHTHAEDEGRGEDDAFDEDQGEGSSDEGEEEGEEDGDGPAVPDIQFAAERLCKLTGLPLETALTALRETQEEVLGGGGAGGGNAGLLQTWLEEAQVWLACKMETEVEIEDIREAMKVSLEENELRKAADNLSVTERPPDYLRERFAPPAGSAAALTGAPASTLFARLSAFACHRALFAERGGHKAPLVKLADLECKCHKWYPNKGTARFWDQLASDCAAAAAEAAQPTSSLLQEQGWVGCENGPEACSACAAALRQADAGPSTSAAASAPARVALSADAAAAAMAAVGDFAGRKEPEIQREISKMPTIGGQVPDVFALLDDPPGVTEGCDSDSDVIEIIEIGQVPGAGGRRETVEV